MVRVRIFSRQQRARPAVSGPIRQDRGDRSVLEVTRETARDSRVALDVPSEDELRELCRSDLNPAHWAVTDGARIYSDGIPDLARTKVTVSGAGARVFIASDARLLGISIDVLGSGASLFIGSDCNLQRVMLRAWGSNALLAIGRDTSWQSGSCLCLAGQQIVIGDDCMMSSDVIIRTYDAHAIFDRRTRARVNAPAPVVLESHVWLGQRSTVNKGTRIGTGSVVGSDSVVGGQLDGSCVYAGVPARRIRRNVAWSRTKHWDDIPAELQ